MKFPQYYKSHNDDEYFCIFKDGRFIRIAKPYENEQKIFSLSFGIHFSQTEHDDLKWYCDALKRSKVEITEDEFNERLQNINYDFKEFHEKWLEDIEKENEINQIDEKEDIWFD